jgi:sulfopyruvate decarboxylase subunit beta
VITVRSVDSFKAAVTEAMLGNELTTIIAKVEARGPAAYVTDLSLLENRFQFRRHIQSLKTRKRGAIRAAVKRTWTVG